MLSYWNKVNNYVRKYQLKEKKVMLLNWWLINIMGSWREIWGKLVGWMRWRLGVLSVTKWKELRYTLIIWLRKQAKKNDTTNPIFHKILYPTIIKYS